MIIDIDAEEQQRSQNETDPINNISSKNKAENPKKSTIPKKVK